VREAKERQEETYRAPKQKIVDAEELAEYRLKKRKEFEDLIRRVYWNEAVWVKYAKWEESQKDFARARSVWERALDHNYRSQSLWLKYAEMEMAHKFVNHARNVWDRAVKLLPRVDQFWYKYIHMEEMMGQIANARAIFEAWMRWEPDHNGWNAYVKMETRYKEWGRIRHIYERYVQCHPSVKAWVRWAKFEMSLGEVARCRAVYEDAVETMEREVDVDQLYVKFAQFETIVKEPERARAIYKYALDNLPKEKAQEVYDAFTNFEKQHGDRGAIEDVIVGKQRVKYEEELEPTRLRTTLGSTTPAWRNSTVTWTRPVRCTSARSRTCRRRTRSVTGSVTYTCGSTTRSSRRRRRATSSGRGRCTASALN
jgi:crooked neck